MQTSDRKPLTYLGIFFAIFATPLFLWGFRLDVGEAGSPSSYLLREITVFVLLGVLLLFIRKGERLPFSSIGWHANRLGRSALWALLMVAISAAVLLGSVGIAQLMHWKLGAQQTAAFEAPLWAMTITVLRAGITEEVFYRGYAMERILKLTGNKWAAVLLSLLPFALFHYRQGPAGIMIAFAIGLVFSLFYLKRRDLPANILAHFTVDFIPNVLLPLLGVVS